MKQNKIIQSNNNNIYDKIENKIIKSLISFMLICLLLLWGSFPSIILSLLKINYNTISQSTKVIIAFINDILLLIILISIYFKSIKKDFSNYFNKDWKTHLKESFSYWLMGLGIMIFSNYIIAILTNGKLAENEVAVRSLIDSFPLYMAFQLMIYAPLTEEIIFRKSIKNIFQNKYLYIFTSGFIFGGLHVLSSLNNPLGLLYLIPYCSLGFIFAKLYHKTDNIFSTITAHAIHNSLALIIYLIGVQ